jgi:hypothetical protein
MASTGILFFLITSLTMFILLMAIVLIMVVLLLWIHPLPHSCNSILVAKMQEKGNSTRADDIE